jgi:hypothetical protein
VLAVPAGDGAAAPLRLEGWGQVRAAFSGGHLVYVDAGAAVTDRFVYWRAEAWRVPVGPRGFAGPARRAVVVRTSAGPMTGVTLATDGGSGFVMAAVGRGFPPPVVWCCTPENLELVIESDGRADAPVALAAGPDVGRIRMVMRRGAATELVSSGVSDDVNAQGRTVAPFPGRPGPGLVAVAPRLVAWSEEGGRGLRWGVPSDAGVAPVRTLAAAGQVLRVWVAHRMVVALERSGGRVAVARYDLPSGRRRVVWRGSGVPQVAAGGGAVAVASGRTVLAGRGSLLRPVRRAAGVVSAVAVDARRVAVFERIRRSADGRSVRSTALRVVRLP